MRRKAMAFLRTLWAGCVRGPLGFDGADLFPMCRGGGMAGMAAELDGGGGAGRIGWKRIGWYSSSAEVTVRDVRDGVVWQ
jgi:hypothetical protein